MTRTLSAAALVLIMASSFAFAETNSGNNSRESREMKPAQTLNVTCIQNAIEKRDSAIITTHTVFSTSITSALTTRKDALKLSWAKPTREERSSSRKATYDAFKTAQKSTHETLRNVRKSSWSTFDTEMKACGVSREAHGERASEVKEPTSSL